MTSGHVENEIKLRVPDPENSRKLLESSGFRLVHDRRFEADTVFDTPGGTLRAARHLLRLRQTGATAILTFKGKAEPARHKRRPEIETAVDDPAALSAILQALGYVPVFRYEKYRTEYATPEGGGIATIDETPIGAFLELEGETDWVDATAHRLGFKETDYILASYGSLYFDHCRALGITPTVMTFHTSTDRL